MFVADADAPVAPDFQPAVFFLAFLVDQFDGLEFHRQAFVPLPVEHAPFLAAFNGQQTLRHQHGKVVPFAGQPGRTVGAPQAVLAPLRQPEGIHFGHPLDAFVFQGQHHFSVAPDQAVFILQTHLTNATGTETPHPVVNRRHGDTAVGAKIALMLAVAEGGVAVVEQPDGGKGRLEQPAPVLQQDSLLAIPAGDGIALAGAALTIELVAEVQFGRQQHFTPAGTDAHQPKKLLAPDPDGLVGGVADAVPLGIEHGLPGFAVVARVLHTDLATDLQAPAAPGQVVRVALFRHEFGEGDAARFFVVHGEIRVVQAAEAEGPGPGVPVAKAAAVFVEQEGAVERCEVTTVDGGPHDPPALVALLATLFDEGFRRAVVEPGQFVEVGGETQALAIAEPLLEEAAQGGKLRCQLGQAMQQGMAINGRGQNIHPRYRRTRLAGQVVGAGIGENPLMVVGKVGMAGGQEDLPEHGEIVVGFGNFP